MLASILLLDSDSSFIKDIMYDFLSINYGVLWSYTGNKGISLAKNNSIDLIITDVLLDDMTMLDLTVQIRSIRQIPILICSSCRDKHTIVTSLQYADDYVTRPYYLPEFNARIKVLLRKSPYILTSVILDPLKIDLVNSKVEVYDKEVYFTPCELSLLLCFSNHPNTLIPFEQLHETLWNNGDNENNQSIMVHISNIRKKLNRYAKGMFSVESVRNKGYILKCEV